MRRALLYSVLAVAVTASARAPASPPDSSAAARSRLSPAVRRFDEDMAIFERQAGGVFAIASEHGCGSGFLADARGLVVTSARVLGAARRIRVQLDDSTRVGAVPLHVDPHRDLAVVWIHPDFCAGRPVLPPRGPRAAEPRAGERVLAVRTSPTARRSLVTGTVRRFDGEVLQCRLRASRELAGGPLLGLDGEVMGVLASVDDLEPGDEDAVAIDARGLAPILAAAATYAETDSLPRKDLYPSLGHVAYPPAALKTLAGAADFDPRPYSLGWTKAVTPARQSQWVKTPIVEAVRVVLLTPPALFGMMQRAEASAVREQGKHGDADEIGGDAFEDLRRRSVRDGRWLPAVQVTILHRIRSQADWMIGKTTLGFQGDLDGLDLLRDGETVEDFERGRVWTPVALTSSGDAAGNVQGASLLIDPRAFLPQGGRWPAVRVRVPAGAPGQAVEVPVPQAALERIARDFGPWLAATGTTARDATPTAAGGRR